MSPNRTRFVWPALCVVLAVSLAGSTFYWHHQSRMAVERKKKQSRQPAFDKRDGSYFQQLATLRGYQWKPPLTVGDAARLAAYDRIDLNKQWAIERNSEPATLATRTQTFPQTATIPLAPTMQVQIPPPFKQFRYELTNTTDHSNPAPILFRDDRWDSVEALVTKAGFKSIPDEVERAIAIWRFVCPRRIFGDPPTEGVEEHDVVKFLSCYGYGFCDDSARAVATLAESSGLKSRIWELNGHVVAEIMANGKWRMFDADQQAYFHRPDAPLDIVGVAELSTDPAAFSNIVSFRNATEYLPKYRDAFLSRDDNRVTTEGTAEHRIAPVLRAGEQMAFTNYNWGRYFLGKFPNPPPRFYNGTFTYTLGAQDFKAAKEIKVEPMENGCRLHNASDKSLAIELPFSYPFPIVGGMIQGVPTLSSGSAKLQVEDSDHRRSLIVELKDKIRIDLDYFVAVLTSDPTNRYSLIFTLAPQTVLELRDLKVFSDFQFAGMALLPLTEGANEVHAYFPEKSNPADFKLTVSWR